MSGLPNVKPTSNPHNSPLTLTNKTQDCKNSNDYSNNKLYNLPDGITVILPIPSSGAWGPKVRGSALFAKDFRTPPADGIIQMPRVTRDSASTDHGDSVSLQGTHTNSDYKY